MPRIKKTTWDGFGSKKTWFDSMNGCTRSKSGCVCTHCHTKYTPVCNIHFFLIPIFILLNIASIAKQNKNKVIPILDQFVETFLKDVFTQEQRNKNQNFASLAMKVLLIYLFRL